MQTEINSPCSEAISVVTGLHSIYFSHSPSGCWVRHCTAAWKVLPFSMPLSTKRALTTMYGSANIVLHSGNMWSHRAPIKTPKVLGINTTKSLLRDLCTSARHCPTLEYVCTPCTRETLCNMCGCRSPVENSKDVF